MTTKAIYSLILYYIYIHTSKTSGKSYIGVSNNIKRRKRQHNQEAHNQNCSTYNTHFHRGIRKYGIDDFTTEILWATPNQQTAYLAEVYFIATHNTFLGEGYNGSIGGNKPPSRKGQHHSEKTKKYLSKLNMGTNHPQYGKKRSRKAIQNMSKCKIGNTSRNKKFKITFPDKHVEIISGLKCFCAKHSLNYGLILSAKKKNKPYKGYSVIPFSIR